MRGDVRRTSSRRGETRPALRGRRRGGMTLLELILSLALSVLVLGAVTMAIGLFLRTLDSRRSQVEETQIARAVLRMIADDLHGAVQQEKLDFTQAGNQASSAGAALSDAASGAGGTSGSGTSGGTGTTSGTSSGGSTPGGGSPGGGSSGGSGASSGGSTGTSSGSTTGANTSSGTSGAATDSGGASQNIDQATTVPPVPGIFGNQYQLQVDISRVPRIDELMMRQTSMDGSAIDIPSDMKSVAYYVRTTEAQAGTGFSAAAPNSALGRQMRRPGLVRRQLDRAVTMYASQNGRTTDLNNREQLVAPEVIGVEFRYFDGTQWLTSWDSIEQNRLPSAIEIIVAVQPGGEQFGDVPAAASTPTGSTQAPLMFRQLVRLPAARPCPAPSTAESTDGTAAATDGSTTSGTGSSGTGGTGTSGGGSGTTTGS